MLNALKPVLFQIHASTSTMLLSSGVASSYTPPPYQRILSGTVAPDAAAVPPRAAAPAAPAAADTWMKSPRDNGSLMEASSTGSRLRMGQDTGAPP